MNGMERVLGTIAGEALDRRAFAPVLSLYGARLTGTRLADHYTDAAAYARGAAAVRETFAPDVLFAPFTFAGIGEAFGSEIRWYDDQPPNVQRPALDSAARWQDLRIPHPWDHPRIAFLREAVARMASDARGEVPIAVPLPSPVDLPALVMGFDAWMEAVLFEPEEARAVTDDCASLFVRLGNELLAAGGALLVVPSGLTAPHVMTRALTERFAVPALAAAFSRLTGPVVLHHIGARMLGTLDLVAGLPGVVGFAIDEADDPARAREILGPGKVLLAGPTGPALPATAPGELEGRCRRLLEGLRADPRLVLFTAGADVPLDTPPDRIHALRRAAEAVAWTS